MKQGEAITFIETLVCGFDIPTKRKTTLFKAPLKQN